MDKIYNPYGVQIGEVWVENDPRHPRKICVMEFLDHVCPRNGAGYARIKNLATGKMSEARLDRFNGRRGGYKLASAIQHKGKIYEAFIVIKERNEK